MSEFRLYPYVRETYGYNSGFVIVDDNLAFWQNRFNASNQRALDKVRLQQGEYHTITEKYYSVSRSTALQTMCTTM